MTAESNLGCLFAAPRGDPPRALTRENIRVAPRTETSREDADPGTGGRLPGSYPNIDETGHECSTCLPLSPPPEGVLY